MAALGYGNGYVQSGVALLGLGTVANGATTVSSGFTLPLVSNSADAVVDQANLQLNCSSFTPTAGGYLQGVFLTSDDGTNFDPYWSANSQLFPTDGTFFTYPTDAAATTLIRIKGLLMPGVTSGSNNVQLVLLNETGVSITINSAALYPYGGDVG